MKFVKVNMSEKSVQFQDVPKGYSDLGGRGLTSVMINAEVPAKCDPLGPEAIPAFGIRVLQAEREFNRKAGFTSKDDRLPEFFYKEPLPPHNKVFLVSDNDLDSTFNF